MKRFIKSFYTHFLLFFLLSSCASVQYQNYPGHHAFDAREYTRAALLFEEAVKRAGANKLLFLLDQGVSLSAAQNYKKAAEVFLRAEKFAEIKDYTSLSEEGAAFLLSDDLKVYRGEDFEKILINVYLALNFAAMDKQESARVEARKINQILYKMIHEGKRPYQESPFARYLSALLWETEGNWSSAHLDYEKTYELDPSFPHIASDLLRSSKMMGYHSKHRKWKRTFPRARARKIRATEGELVVFFQEGRAPVKMPSVPSQPNSLPVYKDRTYLKMKARIKVGKKKYKRFYDVLNISQLSKQFLSSRLAGMQGRRMLKTGVKAGIAALVGATTKKEGLGWLTYYGLMAMDRTNYRSWSTLPAKIKMLRIPLKAGTYKVQFDLLDASGNISKTQSFEDLTVEASSKRFLFLR